MRSAVLAEADRGASRPPIARKTTGYGSMCNCAINSQQQIFGLATTTLDFVARYFDVHPENPQPRMIGQVVDLLRAGGLVAYPTDSCFALGCQLDNRSGLERIREIRQLDSRHHFTLVCARLHPAGPIRTARQRDLPRPQGIHARTVHLHRASDPRSAKTNAVSQETYSRGSHS